MTWSAPHLMHISHRVTQSRLSDLLVRSVLAASSLPNGNDQNVAHPGTPPFGELKIAEGRLDDEMRWLNVRFRSEFRGSAKHLQKPCVDG